jgi:hypothetical protein
MVFNWFRRKASRDVLPEGTDAAAVSRTLAVLAAALQASPDSEHDSPRAAVDDPSIDVARHRFIAFRQIFPPPLEPGLSFYGGVPVGPTGMEWPRGSDGRSLTFVMQWDVAALAAEDATGLLPRDGALYFFSNFAWGTAMAFRFMYASGEGRDWKPLPEPHDLPPVFGEAAAERSPLTSPDVPAGQLHAPRLLPRWPFVPVGIDYTKSMAGDEENGEGRRFWPEGPELSEALLRAQDPFATPRAPMASKAAFQRPFPAFPHDWASVRVVAAAALKQLRRPARLEWQRFMPETDAAAREAMAAAWQKDALALYNEAAAFPASAAVPPDRAAAIWGRVAQMQLVFWPTFDNVVDEAVNLSFGLGSEAAATIPPDLVAACAQRHSLAVLTMRRQYAHEFKADRGLTLPEKEVFALYEATKAAGELKQVRDIWAPPPNRMFGPPRYVQGDVEELVDEFLLLLELSSSESIGLPMGDGVLQFLIRPDDLRARRFDRVQAICTGY